MHVDRVIAGKYRLVAKLSAGGMGSVWQAEHLELKSAAAVKLLDASFLDSSEALTRFKREAQSAASLRCANIVQIFDYGVDQGVPYIVMELLRGQSLAERLTAQGRLSRYETADILSQVARAVARAHAAGIIHRDLKPGNIFLSDDAGEKVVKLVDFGIAKPSQREWNNSPVTLTGAVMGTPQYMSPEQASARRVVDHRTDIWSFGIVAFECLTGSPPFWSDTLAGLLLAICTDPVPIPSQIARVPIGFDEWFARCTHRDPDCRFTSIAETSDLLQIICNTEVEAASPVPRFDPRGSDTLQSSSHPAQTRQRPARPETDTPTSAPSTLTLASRLAPLHTRSGYALFFGLLGALTVVAFHRHFATTFVAHSAAIAQPLQTMDPIHGLPQHGSVAIGPPDHTNTMGSISAAAPASSRAASSPGPTPVIPKNTAAPVAASTRLTPGHTKAPSNHRDHSGSLDIAAATTHSPSEAAPAAAVPTAPPDSVEREFGFKSKRTY